LIIKKLVELNKFSIKIIAVPTERESNGLAMSSRNLRLSEKGLETASKIHSNLKLIKDNFPHVSISNTIEELNKVFDY